MSLIKTPLKAGDKVQAWSIKLGYREATVLEIIDSNYVLCAVGSEKIKYSVTNIDKNY